MLHLRYPRIVRSTFKDTIIRCARPPRPSIDRAEVRQLALPVHQPFILRRLEEAWTLEDIPGLRQ